MSLQDTLIDSVKTYIGKYTIENERCYVEIEHRRQSNGTDILTVSGSSRNNGGQMQDTIREWITAGEFKIASKYKQEDIIKLLDIWDEHHLNDFTPGTPEQMKHVKEFRESINLTGFAYDKECEYLKSVGLYEDNGYVYGSAWLTCEIPDDVWTWLNKNFGLR